MSFRFILGFIVLMIIMLGVNLFVTGLGAMVAIASAWMLASMTELTFSQALLIGGVNSCFFLFIARQSFGFPWAGTLIFTLMGASMFSSAWALVAWGVARYTPFSFWDAMLLSTGIGLVFLYSLNVELNQEEQTLMKRLKNRGLQDESEKEYDEYDEATKKNGSSRRTNHKK